MYHPAQAAESEAPEFDDTPPADVAQRQAITDLCTAWGAWQREAKCIEPQGGRGRSGDIGPAATYTQLLLLNDAVHRQPRTAIDRRVFELYYLHAARNIKCEAARLGISRQHFYRLLWAFEARVYRATTRMAASFGEQPL